MSRQLADHDGFLPAPGGATSPPAPRPAWWQVLRAAREARGITQEGWAAQLGVGARTVQRWEQGDRPPDARAEAAILAYCAEHGLFRSFREGALRGWTLTADGLQELLAAARLDGRSNAVRTDVAQTVATPPRWTGLSAEVPRCIGREQDLARITARLCGTGPDGTRQRLVTLTGPGGSGKTRLALEVAQTVADAFADGVMVVPLAALTDPELVPTTLAQTLGLHLLTGEAVAERLVSALEHRQVLLVLDTFERVLGATPLLVELLARCPRLQLLVTSRAVLGLRSERVVAVPPLALPDPDALPTLAALGHIPAVALFLERAQQARPDFVLTAADAATIAQLCVRLDGLPLALELAAARLRVLSPQALLARLDQRLPLLTGGPHDLPARQQSLRATIAWSYDLLPPAEQALFRRLAVFVGSLTAEAAEAVCASIGTGNGTVLDGLTRLTEHSLLVPQRTADGEVRLGMLDTIREFAHEQLVASGEQPALARHHAAYYRALAEAAEPFLLGANREPWYRRLTAEQLNLRAALHWAVEQRETELGLALLGALGGWSTFVWRREGLRWARVLLAHADRVGAVAVAVRAKALLVGGVLAMLEGDGETGRRWLVDSVSLYREGGDQRYFSWALGWLGQAMMVTDLAEARRLTEESLATARAAADPWLLAPMLMGYAANLALLGEQERAEAVLAAAIAQCRVLGDRWWIGVALDWRGQFAMRQHRYAAARQYFAESRAALAAVQMREEAVHRLTLAGWAACRGGDAAGARTALVEALQECRALGFTFGMVLAVEAVAAVAIREGQPMRAAQLLGCATALAGGHEHSELLFHQLRQETEADTRAALGDARYADAEAIGRACSRDQALALAEAVAAGTAPPETGLGGWEAL